MKNALLTILFLFFALASFAQQDTLTNETATLASIAPHGRLTYFINRKFYDSVDKLGWFLQFEQAMREVNHKYEDGKSGKTKDLIITYKPSTSFSDNNMKIRYTISSKTELISNVVITGYYEYVINLFVEYWNTSIDLESVKRGEIAIKRLGKERITLKVTPSAKTAQIVISNN